MMKKFINAISLASFISIVFVVGTVSLGAGIYVASYIADMFCIAGTLWALTLVPVILVVSFVVEAFLLLGLKRFQKPACGFNG